MFSSQVTAQERPATYGWNGDGTGACSLQGAWQLLLDHLEGESARKRSAGSKQQCSIPGASSHLLVSL